MPPTLSVVGGTGIPGGTVNVTFALSNDSSDPNVAACAAGITMTFDREILSFTGNARPPRCTVASRLSESHVIQGPGESDPGVFDADVFANPAGENSPLGNGDIATCAFNVGAGAPVGTTEVVLSMPPDSFLNNCQGVRISPANFVKGEVLIALPTPTFTVTATPTTVATSTRTVGTTATSTATATVGPPTSTRTVGTTATATATVVPPTSTRTVVATSTSTVQPTSTRTVGTTATATHTGSPRSTATKTAVVGSPTSTATRTSGGGTPTRTAQRSSEDDGCNIVAPEQAGSGGAVALLLAPAILLWMRRRRF